MLKKLAIFFFLILFVFGIMALYAFDNFGKTTTKEDEEKFSALPYYKDGIFISPLELTYNKDAIRNESSLGSLRFVFNGSFAPKETLPQNALTKASFSDTPESLAMYWLGHCSLITEINGKRLALDLVLGNAGPLPFIVPRYSPSPLDKKDLPLLDYFLISHNHYDHLEASTVKYINKNMPSTKFIVPLGLSRALEGWGVSSDRIIELAWDESYSDESISITAFTGVHYSGRSPWDKNRTAWNSYGVKSDKINLFLGGDTGYSTHFKDIAQKYGPFDFVALEVDGWNPGWPQTHVFPDEALLAVQDLGSKYLLPIHWGVFELALHPFKESVEMIVEEANKAGIQIQSPLMGEKFIPTKTVTTKWWEGLE